VKNRKNKKINLYFKIISALLIISVLLSSVLLIYFEILPIFYLSLFIIIIGLIVSGLLKLMNSKKIRKWLRLFSSIISIFLIILFTMICFYAFGTIDFFSSIFDAGIRHDSYSVYVLDNNLKKISNLENKLIGISDLNEDATKKAIDKVSKKIEYSMAEYDNLSFSLDALFNNDVDAILALDSSVEILKEENEEYKKLKQVYTFTVTTKVETLSSDIDISKENFVFYISGIDTNGKVGAKARSDVNILVAVNPKKHKILLLNTPRDYYVKLSTKNAYDKLTHAGVYGIEESVKTLGDFYGMDVPYYARVNFTTFINIVEKLGGITVDVPVDFCEQTSIRNSTKKICLKKGRQTLNGEQALALSRTRYSIAGGDRGRIENQMLVLEAIIDKMLSPDIIIKYNGLLGSISDSIITNIDQKSVTKLIKKQIRDGEGWTIESFSVNGSDGSSSTYSTGSFKVYVMMPDEKTVLEAKKKLDNILETNKYNSEKSE